ncbi:pyrroloquinoline quinone-dependent dehydrogenase [Celeribacter indicus]|uniref:Quinoprotein glucose dehydrogenase n=1 Tax=Celeribacter indicus TaxID=1208324 RepID=A0A0B5E019_9RHOB|nr:pyrroloquinoline quinone-dependent dehydrogenase [Celeribacter indicus]AJE49048.1 Quinoprotein glucose dehydrogenase precursor [Celeribacter indicus]SDW44609.1 quinoprotein glucose dehydrogenase [Celeribacter indicus]
MTPNLPVVCLLALSCTVAPVLAQDDTLPPAPDTPPPADTAPPPETGQAPEPAPDADTDTEAPDAGVSEPGETPAAPAEEPPGAEPAPPEDTAPPADDGPAADDETDAPEPAAPAAPPETGTDTTTTDTTTPAPAERPAADLPAQAGADWPFYGGGANATRYSPLDQIDRSNVGDLERAFVYRTGDMPEGTAEGKYSPETTPLKIGDDLVMCSAMNILISIDAATGEENWRFDPGVPNDAIPYGASCRGVSTYTNPDAAEGDLCATKVIEGTLDAKLVAVDLETGEPCEEFGENGTVDLWQDIGERVPGWYAVTAPPAVVRGIVVTGAQVKDGQAEDAPSGVIRGYDAVTGEFLWAWDLGAPDANRDGPPEGEIYTRGTPNMWTTAVSDEELGYVYLPMGNSSVDYYGSNRFEAENEYATSLVALDATTGEPVWHFQTVRHDVWDYDLGSQPTLIDFDGTPAIILPSKQGDIYILDRETGEPLTPVGELSGLPKGEVEPDYISDTQPYSEWHTLRMEPLEPKDAWGFTPIDQLWCRIQFHRANYEGYFTPPSSERPWIQYPGYNGGSDWGSVAVDPERGVLVANYNDVPNYNRLLTREEADARNLRAIHELASGETSGENAEGAGDPQAGSPYAIDVNAGWRNTVTGMPCVEPPYGGIRAVDLETGETLWDTPLGTARKNGPFGIPSMLPVKIGTPNNGGAVVTAGGLIFIAAATDDLFRAIDIETGETVWSDKLPAGGQANPIAYEVNGKQYVMVAAVGHHFMETPVGDYLIAYALP